MGCVDVLASDEAALKSGGRGGQASYPFSTLSTMAVDISDQFGDIGGALRAVFGLTRPNRLRDQIRGTIELYEMAARNPELSGPAKNLAAVVDQETNRLLEASNSSRREWNWGALITCWIVAGGLGALGYFVFAPHLDAAWAVILIVIVGILGSLFVIAGLGVLLQRKKDAI
jgi:hypothetical protein